MYLIYYYIFLKNSVMLLDFLNTAPWKIQDIDFPGFIN